MRFCGKKKEEAKEALRPAVGRRLARADFRGRARDLDERFDFAVAVALCLDGYVLSYTMLLR